jgi:cytochrome c-type biogenesis protein CcsB
MAAASDQLLVVTILAYLAAMVCYAAEYAFASRPERIAAEPPAGPAIVTGPRREASAGTRPGSGRTVAERIGRLAWGGLLAAAGLHLATAVTRGVAAGRVPWGNMYEYLVTATLVGALAWLWIAARRPSIRRLGLYLALVNVLLLGLAGMAFPEPIEPLVPALNSYWLLIHVAAMVAATGLFLVGFVAAALHLVRMGHDRGRSNFPFTLGPRLPVADALERLTFRLHAIGFPIWTFAVIAGAIWAEAAWGRYWGWDPKEVWAFVSWVVYAAYLHARATSSVRRTVVAGIAIAGWVTMMMNLFGVNFLFDGLHTYA